MRYENILKIFESADYMVQMVLSARKPQMVQFEMSSYTNKYSVQN